jgi:hypothetical protein
VNVVFALLGCYAAFVGCCDVSGQPVGPVLKGQTFKGKCQAVKEFFDSLTLEYGADGLSRPFTNYQSAHLNIAAKRRANLVLRMFQYSDTILLYNHYLSHICFLEVNKQFVQLLSQYSRIFFKFMVPCILNNGNFVQLDDTVLFDTFTHSLHVSGIYHPSSGATLQIGAVGITTYCLVLCPGVCHIRLVLFITLCKW